MKKWLMFFSILYVFAGCMTMPFQESGMVGKYVSETMTPTMRLVVLLGDYYKKYQSWPENESQLRQFSAKQGQPFFLEKFEKIVFETETNDSLKVDYKFTARAVEQVPKEDKELYTLMSEGTLSVSPPDENGQISAQPLNSYGSMSVSQDR